MTPITEPSTLAGWLPYQLYNGTDARWIYPGTLPYTDPFFDETISKCKSLPENGFGKRYSSAVDVLPGWSAPDNALPPAAIIFHVSRCGSTLLSQLLGLNPNHIVLAEVPFFDDLLRARYKQGGKDLSHLLPHAVSYYAQKRTGTEERLFIKADSWHLFFYEEIRAHYPDVPFILLYRRPDEVVASQEKKKGMHAVPGVIESEIFNLGQLPAYQEGTHAYVAAILEQYYQRMQQIHAKDPLAYLVNYNEGFGAITEKVYQLTHTPFTEKEQQDIMQRCGFDAKEPEKKFALPATGIDETAGYLAKAFKGYHQLEKLRM
ncbi:hypothetical protein SAMN05421788_11051 [Filimonas lacunae]|uniref:Sulfotransferase family protein n=1 Tax=Filimonas lacunae TaxID=477680 RepID=A0A173M9X6_9BACT|nr:sulfotransferase [Filimonas lacunae]BAV04322.1 hypothetical protein FLA_0309 [Filimonas lacunae]SIT31020.1 hypothetical protein SAMN05421788_11051 [Filimonas lacunae]